MKKRRLLILSALLVPMMVGTLSTASCHVETPPAENLPIETPEYKNDGNYLEIAEKPTKTEYLVGERLSFEGLRIVKYSIVHDVKSEPLTVSKVDYVASIEEGTELKEATPKLTVTISLKDTTYKSVSFDVVVKERDQHTITFENHDGTVLSTQLVTEGGTIVYEGTTPIKEDVGDVAYRFDGWYVKGDDTQTLVDIATLEVTGSITLVAHFKEGSQSSDGTFVYNLSADVSHYELLGIDKEFDYAKTDLVIPALYNGKPVKTIAAKCFEYEDTLTSIVIGKNVEEIGDHAFNGCSGITSIKFEEGSILAKLGIGVFSGTRACKSIEGIPNTLKRLPKETFRNSGISTIDLGQGLEVIESEAFEYAKNLVSIEFPDSVTTIEAEAFSSNDMLETVKFGKGLKDLHPNSKLFEQDNVYRYEVSPENPNFKAVDGILYSKDGKTLVNVPRGYVEPGEDGKVTPITFTINDEVEVLGEYSLTYHQKDFSNVVLGKNVREIKDNAFKYSTNCNITWNEKLEVIGMSAFQGVSGLVGDIVMPDSVTTIKDFAFKGCSKITSFTFGANMEHFGQRIFDGNRNVVLKFSASNTKLSIEGNVVYDSAKTKCLYWTGVDTAITEYAMPNTIKEVAPGFLYEVKLTKLTLSTALEIIGSEAFSGMSKLTGELVLPETVTYIGDSAFERTFNSSSYAGTVTFPSKVKHLGNRAFANTRSLTFANKVVLNSDLEFLGNEAFGGASLLAEVEFNYKELTERLFASCSNLKVVKLPNTLTRIAKEAFEGCKALDNINVPTSLEEVGMSAFESCSALATFDLSNIKILRDSAFKGSGLTNVTLTNKLEILEDSVFYGTNMLEKATFDLELKTLPYDIFYDSGLKEIVYPKNLQVIGENAFQNCANLVEVSLPNTVTTLGDNTFKNCSKLTKAILPDSITIIGNNTFEGCVELTEVTLPKNLTVISPNMFKNCAKITSITLPEGITSFGYSAFQGVGFTSFTLPENVDISKATYLFNGSKLESFTFNSTVDMIPMNMFGGCTNLVEIKGLKEGQLKKIDSSAFYNCSNLETLSFDMSAVTEIGSSAFYNCKKLKSISLPTNAEYTIVQSGLFNGCSALTEITIPANVLEVKGSNTFASTTSLTSIRIENPEIKLGTYLSSSYNSGLKEIHFNGTMEQAQKAITKRTFNVNDLVVKCSDGEYVVK